MLKIYNFKKQCIKTNIVEYKNNVFLYVIDPDTGKKYFDATIIKDTILFYEDKFIDFCNANNINILKNIEENITDVFILRDDFLRCTKLLIKKGYIKNISYNKFNKFFKDLFLKERDKNIFKNKIIKFINILKRLDKYV